MKFRIPLIACSCFSLLFSGFSAFGEVKVSVGEVSDHRSSKGQMGGLSLQLLLAGEQLADVKGSKVVVEKAVDDGGANLLEGRNAGFGEGEFRELQKAFGMDAETKGKYEVRVRMSSPTRAAKSVNVSGTIELLMPSADSSSSISVDLTTNEGKEVDHASLKDAGAKIVFEKPTEIEVKYKVVDPKGIIASIQLVDAAGKPIETHGSSATGVGHSKTCSISVAKLPEKFSAKIQLKTEKSIVKVPWKLENVKLP